MRKAANDISEQFTEAIKSVDWNRRLKCKFDLKLFCETYLQSIFNMAWSNDQLALVDAIQSILLHGGNKAVAQPRGGGKTAILRAGNIWACAYAHRVYPVIIGSTKPAAKDNLASLSTQFHRNDLLYVDFPEVCLAVRHIDGSNKSAEPYCNGVNTGISWGAEALLFPSIVLNVAQIELYSEYDPDAIMQCPTATEEQREEFNWPHGFATKTSGIVIDCHGIDSGNIRGSASTNPVLLNQPRPDSVLIDDVQKDQNAESPLQVEKITKKVEKAIMGLAGPGHVIAAGMGCTVIAPDDVADTYIDRTKRPEWFGVRGVMVETWPDGISDDTINRKSPAGKLWTDYANIRNESLQEYGDIRLATEFYGNPENRAIMDSNFRCSWPERYVSDAEKYKGNVELSAQQHAMNLRFRNLESFLTEYQNLRTIPKTESQNSIASIHQVRNRFEKFRRFEIPESTKHIIVFIDVQAESLWYSVTCMEQDFTSLVTDFGIYPEFKKPRLFWTKADCSKNALLSRKYFSDQSQASEQGIVRAWIKKWIAEIVLNRNYVSSSEYIINPKNIPKDLLNQSFGKSQLDREIDELHKYANNDVVTQEGFTNLISQLDGVSTITQFRDFVSTIQTDPNLEISKFQIRDSQEILTEDSNNLPTISQLRQAIQDQQKVSSRGKNNDKAPLEKKVINGLYNLIHIMLNTKEANATYNSNQYKAHEDKPRIFETEDGRKILPYIGIDTHWGELTDSINRLIASLPEWMQNKIIPCHGVGIPARKKPMCEGLSNADQQLAFDHCRLTRNNYGKHQLLIDTNYYKSFLHNRLTSPQGDRGSMIVFRPEIADELEQELGRDFEILDKPENIRDSLFSVNNLQNNNTVNKTGESNKAKQDKTRNSQKSRNSRNATRDFQATELDILATHLCKSERSTTVKAAGRTLDEWEACPGNPDNELFDALSNTNAIASMLGCRLPLTIQRNEEINLPNIETATGQEIARYSQAANNSLNSKHNTENLKEISSVQNSSANGTDYQKSSSQAENQGDKQSNRSIEYSNNAIDNAGDETKSRPSDNQTTARSKKPRKPNLGDFFGSK